MAEEDWPVSLPVIYPFIARQSHMGWDPARRIVFAAGVKFGKGALYFKD